MLNKKIVLITGSSSGIGYKTAQYLSSNNFIVYAGTRTPEKLKNDKNDNFIPIKLDVTNNEQILEVIQEIVKKHLKIDILINNAGYGLISTVEDVTEEEMYDQYNINVFGVLRVCKNVIPIMRKQQDGIIINISSFLGKIGLPLFTLYNSSKYAMEGITDSLRYELRPFNVRVHSIMPGFFNTKFAKENLQVNQTTMRGKSPYNKTVLSLIPTIADQVNNGNNTKIIAKLILDIINDDNFKARVTSGDKAKKFIPMIKELSDEDFEKRVQQYYDI